MQRLSPRRLDNSPFEFDLDEPGPMGGLPTCGDGAGTFHCGAVRLGCSHRLATVELDAVDLPGSAHPGLRGSIKREKCGSQRADDAQISGQTNDVCSTPTPASSLNQHAAPASTLCEVVLISGRREPLKAVITGATRRIGIGPSREWRRGSLFAGRND